MIFKNYIKKEYLQTKESLKVNFYDAFRFLDFIERLNEKGFHIGTHKNLHIYFKNSFLFYFNKISSRIIEISSKPNGVIKRQTFNHSYFFFTLLIKELNNNKSDYKNDVEINNNTFKIIVNQSQESGRFFEIVKKTLIEIEKKENLMELFNQIVQITEEFQVFNNDEEHSLLEGIQKTITTTYYERNPKARSECLTHWGYTCVVCGFDFKKTYGTIGEEYIHVHHLNPISEIGEEYEVDPVKDLRPVCPNCHAMIHRKKEPLTIEELKRKIENTVGNKV